MGDDRPGPRHDPPVRLGALAFSGALVVYGTLVVIGVALVLFAVSMPCLGIAALSYRMEVTPDHLRGRVGTAFGLLIRSAVPVGGAVAGTLLDLLAPRSTALVFAAWVVLLSVVAASARGLRRLDRHAPTGAPAPRRPGRPGAPAARGAGSGGLEPCRPGGGADAGGGADREAVLMREAVLTREV